MGNVIGVSRSAEEYNDRGLVAGTDSDLKENVATGRMNDEW